MPTLMARNPNDVAQRMAAAPMEEYADSPQATQMMAPVDPHATLTAPIGPAPVKMTNELGDALPEQAEAPPTETPKMSPLQGQREHVNKSLMANYAKDENPYGSENNHPGFFGKLLHGLNVATGGVNRRGWEERQQEGELRDIAKEESAMGLQGAQENNLELQPQLKLAQQELAHEKQNETESHHQAQNATALAQHGFKLDPKGNVVPLPYEEMSEPQQAVHDLKASQEELADATTALRKAQNDPNSPQFKLAQQRVNNASQSRAVAAQRLGLSEKQFEMRAHGTEGGVALPGSMITEEGQPVGTAFQQNVRPTGQERNKSDMATSAGEQLSDIKSIMQKHPTIFGPGYGQASAFKQWVGSQDPDAQRFLAARTIAADHLAGTFGGRSEAALDALDKAIGQFKDNPKAAIAGIDQLTKANTYFKEKGTVKTAGSNAAKEPTPKSFEVPVGAPAASGYPEGHILYKKGSTTPLAINKGGKWVAP